jgi:kynurenine 3-monooxygenase
LQGFEDCLLLDQLLLKYKDISIVLKEFSAIRNTDAEAICDLAMYNYLEVTLHANRKIFLILLWQKPMNFLLKNTFLKNFEKRVW